MDINYNSKTIPLDTISAEGRNCNQKLNEIEEFVNHNLKLGYIKGDTTIEQLLIYINNVKNRYIPLMEQIKKMLCKRGEIKNV